MQSWLRESNSLASPDSLCAVLLNEPGLVLLKSASFQQAAARYSFVTARPFLTLRTFGARCELAAAGQVQLRFGNPWHILSDLMARFELLAELDSPFPLGGCFGFWGYPLKNFVEPRLARQAPPGPELPDAHLGFYRSLIVFDHWLQRAWIVSTGLALDGSRDERLAEEDFEYWQDRLAAAEKHLVADPSRTGPLSPANPINPNLSRSEFVQMVEQAQRYIRAGHIYQVNLSQRFTTPWPHDPWQLFQNLTAVSPAPFAAYLDCGQGKLISSSPELFLRCHGSHLVTRPIKGTRPRSSDPNRDTQLTYELQTSAKELAELVMITDLLRNDLGRICEYGSIHVAELARLEQYSHVQHLVSTVEGQLRREWSHTAALAACFPGGSVTGAPKIRAMEIIEELEPVSRGPYTGALGYLGFNRESQLSILIRTAVFLEGTAYFHAGAGIVADSIPEAEYEETLAKARGFFAALGWTRSVPAATLPARPFLAAARTSEE